MSPKRDTERRRLMVKIRVITTRPMTEAEAVKLMRRAIRTRYVPEGIKLAGIDWEQKKYHGPHGAEVVNAGEYIGKKQHEALVDFYNAITHPDTKTRIEIVG